MDATEHNDPNEAIINFVKYQTSMFFTLCHNQKKLEEERRKTFLIYFCFQYDKVIWIEN